MPADIINLRQARKGRARADKTAKAAENREKFGRTKAEKTLTKALSEKAVRDLDAHRRDRNEPE